MKKVLFLFLLLLVTCGGSSEETAVEDTTTTSVKETVTTNVQDTTTTTIPPAPTSDTNYVELYNSKLGTELCNDAKEIDTTSEECLRQYKENLNYLITLQNEIGDFASALIALMLFTFYLSFSPFSSIYLSFPSSYKSVISISAHLRIYPSSNIVLYR